MLLRYSTGVHDPRRTDTFHQSVIDTHTFIHDSHTFIHDSHTFVYDSHTFSHIISTTDEKKRKAHLDSGGGVGVGENDFFLLFREMEFGLMT